MSLLNLPQSRLKRFLSGPAQLISLSLVLVVGGCAADNKQTTLSQIPELMDAYDVDGLAVTAVVGDKILFSEGFGVTQNGDAYASSSSCGLYSATKVLASLTYTNLSNEDRIRFDAKLSEYVEDAPTEWNEIPFFRLLNHTSGITMAVNKPQFGSIASNPASQNYDIYNLVKDAPLDYEPGQYSRYRQSGYAVAEMILKKELGASFDELVDQYVTIPAGMTNTKHPAVTDPSQPKILLSAGGYETTADDMARLFLSINNGSITTPTDWKKTLLDENYLLNGYSIGNITEEKDGVTTLGHSGGGARANIRYAPDQKVGVMVCTDDTENNGLAISLARMLIGEITSGEPPLMPTRVALKNSLNKTGKEIVAAYKTVALKPNRYDLSDSEGVLNRLGYSFIAQKRMDEAIEVFSLNADVYPQSPNAHDSLGEALLAAGQTDAALGQYRRVLALDPDNVNATAMIKKIEREPNPQDVQALIDSYAEKRGFTGSVMIANGESILVKSSYGDADVEWGVPNSPTTRYRIGSLTKPMTATLIMTLVEDGTLSLDKTLGEYVPDIYGDTDATEITVEQLLSHRSGIADLPRDTRGPWYQTTARLHFETKDLAREWIKPDLIEKPGEKFRYNNAGFVLLGLIVEEVTGRSYAENLQERVFDPAEMMSSGVFTRDDLVPNIARGYERPSTGGLQHATTIDPSIFAAAADVYSSVGDLHKFDRALHSNTIISEESRVLMMSKKSVVPYGFGWGIDDISFDGNENLKMPFHSGSIPGYQSYYLRSEDNEGFVFVTSNTNQGSLIVEMAKDSMQVLNGKPITLAKRSLDELLMPIVESKGEQAAINAYTELGDKVSEYTLDEAYLNSLGYKHLRLKNTDLALFIFEENVDRNPNAANPYDSLAETYRGLGRVEDAIKNYEKALALDPTSESAKTALSEMRETGE